MSVRTKEPIDPRHHREILSYTRRGGRLTERQQDAWDDIAAEYVIDVPRERSSTSVDPDFRLDPADAFGRQAPLIVEIGSGRGESLVHAAAENPDVDFLGLEVYVPGVAQGLVSMRHAQVTNIRFVVVDAAAALKTMLPPSSVRELRLWFPDPWHKTRHHKRRLISDGFVELAARVLEPGGVWRMATDWQEYADQMSDVLSHADGFAFSGDWGPRFPGRPITRFERKGAAAGRTIRDLNALRMDP